MVWFTIGAIYVLGMIAMFFVIRKMNKIGVLHNVDGTAPLIIFWPITLAVIIAAALKACIDYAKEKGEEKRKEKTPEE